MLTLVQLWTQAQPPDLAVGGLAPTPDGLIHQALLLVPARADWQLASGMQVLECPAPLSGRAMNTMLGTALGDWLLWVVPDTQVECGYRALERMLQVAADTGAGIVYGDYVEERDGQRKARPTIDYQPGSGRDSFNFGPLMLISLQAARQHGLLDEGLNSSGFYDLWLGVADRVGVVRIPEVLATKVERDLRASGQRQHDYCDPARRQTQLELEQVFTRHLQRIGAALPERSCAAPTPRYDFPVTASVIIPILNRRQTVAAAVASALSQKCRFAFNVIVVDNHSSDGTSEILDDLARADRRVVHLRPERLDLGIGGCWDVGIRHAACGRWAVQLDSDDVYLDRDVLQRVVDALEAGPWAMVVGSYRMTDFDFNEIPPGLIDHREWTDANGHNNLLRVNGIGAPRAFDTALLRQLGYPNQTYGEDYAMALRISRQWRIERIWEPLYLCRRWQENSDAALPVETENRYDIYRDRMRSLELAARRQLVAAGAAR